MMKPTIITDNEQTELEMTSQMPVFVYGTLRSGQGNWANILKGTTIAEIPASLPGAKMYSPGIAYVCDAGQSESKVVGDLMFVEPTKWPNVLKRLDSLEGFEVGRTSNHYERVARKCVYTDTTGEQKEIFAWVYFGSKFALSRCGESELVPDGDWLAHLKRQSQRHATRSRR